MGRSRDLADGTLAELNVDSNTLAVDATNNRVGIGTASPSTNLHVSRGSAGGGSWNGYTALAVESPNYAVISLKSPNANFSQILFADLAGTSNGQIAYMNSAQTNANSMQFYTNNAERMRILSSGGITFNGDTADANALDDYEEGAWAPDINFASGQSGSFTFGNNSGRYVKVGKLCLISAFITYTAKPSAGNTLRLTLPFTADSSSTGRGGFYFTYTNGLWATTVYGAAIRTETSQNQATFNYANSTSWGMDNQVNVSHINSSANFMVAGSYVTT